ncbi:MAG: formylglycine-generating enzyme family protein [bacterium]|nr:formylglycine-generating enzyme family protein [bacterium]
MSMRPRCESSPTTRRAAEFVYIAPGTFLMGSPPDEIGRYSNEVQHAVTISRGFYMSRYEVTRQWWDEVMGGGQSTSQLPVTDGIGWLLESFCNMLSEHEGLTPAYTLVEGVGWVWNRAADGYRLPTEAEWEYACRSGSATPFNNGTNCLSWETEANFTVFAFNPYPGCPLPHHTGSLVEVGMYPPNAWGLYDMHGNVWEYVWDNYLEHYESLDPVDPVYEDPNNSRVYRGGHYLLTLGMCRSAWRPTLTTRGVLGFRPVRTLFAEPSLGTIYIDPRPTELDADWTLINPLGYPTSGHGPATLPDLYAGNYTVVWGAVSGWLTPETITLPLSQGGTTTFVGIYAPQTANIIRGGPETTDPQAIPVQITGDDAVPLATDLDQWTGNWQAPQAIYDQGSFVNDSEYWSSGEDGSCAGSTWMMPTPGVGYGILVVDLQQIRTITHASVFQMFCDGKTSHIALAAHPSTVSTPPDAFDPGWTVFLPPSAVGPGENHGSYVSAPARFEMNASTRYVKIMAYNDGSLGGPSFIELKGIKLYAADRE